MQTYRTNFEKEAAKKIQDTLETIMGKDNVSVQVSSVMDFNQTRATIESYTPSKDSNAGVILSSQGEKEVYSNPKDLPSAKADNNSKTPAPTTAQQIAQEQMNNIQAERENNPLLNQAQGASAAQNVVELPLNETPAKTTNYYDTEYGKNKEEVKKLSYEKEKSATTYAVTKEIKQVVYAPGAVVRMSVAVAVNKILTEVEKEEIKNLVIAAAGIDIARGDIVNVSSLKFTGIDNSEELEQDKKEQQEFILEVLTFIFKNVSPVLIILILGLMAMHNFGNVFKAPKPIEEEPIVEEEEPDLLPSFDPYLALQNNTPNNDDFYQQEMQFTSAVDKKKSEIISSILDNPEEAARILTSYIKE